MTTQRFQRWTWFAVLAGLLALVAVGPVSAQNNGKPEDGEGKYANLTAQWWQWVFAQPAIDSGGTNTNPVLDSTGAFAAAGQENGIGPANKYFFLAGTFGGTVVRTVTVPTGKALFFPIYNYEADNAMAPPTSFTVPELRPLAKANIDNIPVSELSAALDGVPVEIFRTTSPTFAYME